MTAGHKVSRDDADEGRPITPLLDRYGEPIHNGSSGRLALSGAHVLWLVTGDSMDLFAVAAEESGGWHFLGRLEPGTIVSGAMPGLRHSLSGRPHTGCALRRISIAEIVRAQREEWAPPGPTRGFSAEEQAVANGIDRGLRVLLDSIRRELPPRRHVCIAQSDVVPLRAGQVVRPVGGILWVNVIRGRMSSDGPGGALPYRAGEVLVASENDSIWCDSDAVVAARTTTDLLADGSLWTQLVEHNARFLVHLNGLIEQQERARHARVAASRAAAKGAHDTANRTLTTVLHAVTNPERATAVPDGHPATAALLTVARAAGITVPPVTSPNPPSGPMDELEHLALAWRLRTRTVQLVGDWYTDDIGPLIARVRSTGSPVALLWRRNRYDMVDPASGRRARLTVARARALEPTAMMLYRSLPDEPITGLQLLKFGLRGHRNDLLRFMIGSVASVVLGLLVPIATGAVLGTLVPNGERGLIVSLCIALVLASLVSAAFSLLKNVSVLRIEGRWESSVQAAVWDRLLRHPTSFFTRFSTGQLATAALGVTRIRRIVSGVAPVAAHSVLLGVVNFGLLLWYSVPLGLVAGALAFVSMTVFVGGGLRQLALQREAVQLDYTLANTVFHMLRALPKLRVAAAEQFAYAQWAGNFARSREVNWQACRIQRVIVAFNAAYLPFCALVLFGLITGPANGRLSMAEFLSFYAAFGVMIAANLQFIGAITSVGAVVPLFETLAPVLEQVPEVGSGRTLPGALSGSINVDQVSFRYTKDSPLVLDRITLHIKPGEFVALVGATGSGKSTLLRLLIGFERPDSGSVRYDGQDLSSLDVTAVRRQFGVVLQHDQPLAGTILSNICGGEEFPLVDAWDAATKAGLADDIVAMPMGMYTVITESMCTLSGGQRQRLMIARAVIRQPRIFFLDEATSALDNDAQRIVADWTRALNATRVVIAHRLSTVMHADRIIVLANGQVVQQGPPGQLVNETDGPFHRLARRQIERPG